MTPQEAIEFIARHGVVLESAKASVPNLADTVAGESIQGSYWGHPMGDEIFILTRAVRSSEEVLVCRLVDGKVTYVHRRLWPSIFRLRNSFDQEHLGALHEVHTSSGKHKVETTPFPDWVSDEVKEEAEALTNAQAATNLGAWFNT